MTDGLLQDLAFLREEISKYSKRAYDRGLIRGTGGNLSIRTPTNKMALVTPTDISLGDVKPEENILVNLQGETIESPLGLMPSKETSFHLRVYRMRSDVRGVVHLHPPYATAYANKGKPLPMVTVSARAKLQQVPNIGCAPPGSNELCELVATSIESFPDARAFLMKEHGILTLGEDLRAAYYLAELVEETAQIAFIEGSIGVK
jgi:ribulose-5-phosphate 4-epimerase/fuculose-1-phosphate aldolase